MSFIVKNTGGTAVQVQDDYVNFTVGAGESVDIEDLYQGELWRFTFSATAGYDGGGALYTAIDSGILTRRNQTDTGDIAIANAFDDAIWLWHLTKDTYDAIFNADSPSITNVFITDTDPRLSDARFPTLHASTHSVGSSDALAVGIPVSIGATNAEGSASDFVRRDHTHQGLHSIMEFGGTLRYGDIVLKEGANITISEATPGEFTFEAAMSATTEFLVTDGSGLGVTYNGGTVIIDGTVYNVSSGVLTLDSGATNYVYVDVDGTVTYNTTGFPPNASPLSTIVTNGSDVTGLTDDRSFVNQNLVWGDTSDVSTIYPDASKAEGSLNEYARVDHVHAIATDVVLPLGLSLVSSEGSSSSFARADHIHGMTTVSSYAGLPATPVDGQTVWVNYGVYQGNYYYDLSRDAWLSNELLVKNWNSSTNVNTGTVNFVAGVDDTQQDNDYPNPFTITVTGIMGTQTNTLASGNTTTFALDVYDVTTGTVTPSVATVTNSIVGDRAIANMSLNVDVAGMTILSAHRSKTGSQNVSRPAMNVWYRIRLA